MTEQKGTLQGQDILYMKLGEVYMTAENYKEAIAAFHAALALNPMNSDVQRSMEKLEAIVRGVGAVEHPEDIADDSPVAAGGRPSY
jgi:uncharacterized protein HemY